MMYSVYPYIIVLFTTYLTTVGVLLQRTTAPPDTVLAAGFILVSTMAPSSTVVDVEDRPTPPSALARSYSPNYRGGGITCSAFAYY